MMFVFSYVSPDGHPMSGHIKAESREHAESLLPKGRVIDGELHCELYFDEVAGGWVGIGSFGVIHIKSTPHVWVRRRAGGDPAEAGTYEMIEYCDNCGGERTEELEARSCPK